MVQDPRAKVRAHRLRPLASPRPVDITTNERAEPCRMRFEGEMQAVAAIEDRWRIDDEWWREAPVSRAYYRLQLEGGRIVTVYWDLIGGMWCEQRY